MISPPRQTAHYFLPARIGGSSYQAVISSSPGSFLGAGPLQGPLKPVIDYRPTYLSSYDTEKSHARGCDLLLRPAYVPDRLPSPFPIPFEHRREKAKETQRKEIRREN